MIRRLVSFASVVSLVLLIATTVLWVRQPGGRWRLPHTRFRLEAKSKGVVVYGPPKSPTGRAPWPALRQAIGRVNNDQLKWEVSFRSPDNDDFQVGRPGAREGTPAAHLMPVGVYQPLAGDAVPLLLDALDDPNRFAAAHVILSNQRLGFRLWTVSFQWDDYPLRGSGTFEGLSATITLPKSSAPAADASVNLVGRVGYDGQIDPAQLPAIRELWHSRLDQPMRAVSYGTLAAIMLAFPGLWLAMTGTRMVLDWRKRRRRTCVRCGYDLRATPERCPECGWAIQARVSA